MDYFSLISQRESCRNYDPNRPVSHQQLTRCLEAARIAPSACNSQPWSFVVVNQPELSAQVAECLQGLGMNKFSENCPAFIVVVEEKATLSARLGGMVKSQEYASIDIGIATAHLVLAATEQGLSTCIMGWFHEGKLKNLLPIPKEKRIRLVIGVGYAAKEGLRPKKRKSLEEIATFLES